MIMIHIYLPYHWNMSLFPHYEIIAHNYLQMTNSHFSTTCSMEKTSYILSLFQSVFQEFLVVLVSICISTNS